VDIIGWVSDAGLLCLRTPSHRSLTNPSLLQLQTWKIHATGKCYFTRFCWWCSAAMQSRILMTRGAPRGAGVGNTHLSSPRQMRFHCASPVDTYLFRLLPQSRVRAQKISITTVFVGWWSDARLAISVQGTLVCVGSGKCGVLRASVMHLDIRGIQPPLDFRAARFMSLSCTWFLCSTLN